jgi:methyl-accepting chemotaxis protein
MRKNSIKGKVLLVIVLGVFLPIIILIIVSGIQYKKQSEEIAKNIAISIAHEYSYKIENAFNSVFSIADVFGDIQTSVVNSEGQVPFSSAELMKNQIEILKKNDQALALYVTFHPGTIIDDNTGELNTTSALIGNTNYKGKISPLVKWDYSYKTNIPDSLRKYGGYSITNPYKDVYGGDTLWMISYVHEIKHNDEIIAVTGVDISIDWMQKFVTQTEIFNNNASVKIVSNYGIINADSENENNVGKKANEILAAYAIEKESLYTSQSSAKMVDGSFVFYEPIEFNRLKNGWQLRIEVPKEEIVGEAREALLLWVIIAVVFAFATLVLTYIYFNKIVARIRNLAAAAKRMAKGNLYIDFETVGNDEITDLGKSLQSIITRFSEIITAVKDTMEKFEESGNALSETSKKLSEGASEQASSSEEVSASMEQMSANIEQNAENAKIADKIAQKSSTEIEESSKNVKITANSMNDIVTKTSVIDDIAFQVNILALNAAVEAARAGVHGKGFGVVANEVGKLADRSKLAASEIDDLTNKSLLVAKKSGQSLEDIVPEIKKTAELVQYITSASLEQKAGAEQINNAIQQLNGVTQQNASIAETLTGNVESLSILSNKLNKLIAFFKLEARKKRDRTNLTNNPKERRSITKETKPLPEKKEKLETKPKLEQSIKKSTEQRKDKTIPKNKSKGIDIDLGENDILDDGFEKF